MLRGIAPFPDVAEGVKEDQLFHRGLIPSCAAGRWPGVGRIASRGRVSGFLGFAEPFELVRSVAGTRALVAGARSGARCAGGDIRDVAGAKKTGDRAGMNTARFELSRHD